MNANSISWIESLGGPLVAMPKSHLNRWGGADADHPMEGDDYERACEVSGYIGQIELGDGFALVIGDTPDRTTIVTTDIGVAIVRWQYADSEQEFWNCFHDQLGSAKVVETMGFVADESEFLLFDSVFAGAELDESLDLSVPTGASRISTRIFAGDRIGFLAHVFASDSEAK